MTLANKSHRSARRCWIPAWDRKRGKMGKLSTKNHNGASERNAFLYVPSLSKIQTSTSQVTANPSMTCGSTFPWIPRNNNNNNNNIDRKWLAYVCIWQDCSRTTVNASPTNGYTAPTLASYRSKQLQDVPDHKNTLKNANNMRKPA